MLVGLVVHLQTDLSSADFHFEYNWNKMFYFTELGLRCAWRWRTVTGLRGQRQKNPQTTGKKKKAAEGTGRPKPEQSLGSFPVLSGPSC